MAFIFWPAALKNHGLKQLYGVTHFPHGFAESFLPSLAEIAPHSHTQLVLRLLVTRGWIGSVHHVCQMHCTRFVSNHNIHWNDSRVLATQDCWSKRKWTEALIIANRQDVLFNRDCGRTIPPNYRNIVHKLYNSFIYLFIYIHRLYFILLLLIAIVYSYI